MNCDDPVVAVILGGTKYPLLGRFRRTHVIHVAATWMEHSEDLKLDSCDFEQDKEAIGTHAIVHTKIEARGGRSEEEGGVSSGAIAGHVIQALRDFELLDDSFESDLSDG